MGAGATAGTYFLKSSEQQRSPRKLELPLNALYTVQYQYQGAEVIVADVEFLAGRKNWEERKPIKTRPDGTGIHGTMIKTAGTRHAVTYHVA